MFDAGRKIRVALAACGRTQVWLIGELRLRGILTDKTEMSSVLSGTRIGPKADRILTTSAEILKEQHGNELYTE